MNELLARILEAHGGVERWRGYEKVEATIVSGGGFFALKGVLQDSNPRRMTAWLHEERSSVWPYGAPDQRTMFTPERIAIVMSDCLATTGGDPLAALSGIDHLHVLGTSAAPESVASGQALARRAGGRYLPAATFAQVTRGLAGVLA